ncbi:MAG: LysR family transcriptional regulator [Pseudomonadota bacterium]
MLDLKDLQCIVALNEHRHFARAAKSCGLSQPAFSVRISNLERALNTAIVQRANRFQQFTPEGEALVAQARAILEKVEELQLMSGTGRGEVAGTLTLGVIPTAIAHAAKAAVWMRRRHPGVRMRLLSTPSLGIQQGLEDGRIDAGLTYIDGIGAEILRIDPIYTEAYIALIPRRLEAGTGSITWSEVAELPLALLEPAMQNRRILDSIFLEAGLRPYVLLESNGFNAAIAMAKAGIAATILPNALAEEVEGLDDLQVRPLEAPKVTKSVGLISPAQSRKSALVNALRDILTVDMSLP